MPSHSEFELTNDNPQREGPPQQNVICGIDQNLLETFLQLIRDNYKKADLAAFFLEQRTGIINVQGVTNIRDVLGHLATFLQPELTREFREEQIANAAEHLRRAVVEPYEVALSELVSQFATLYEKYKQNVLPGRDEHVGLSNAPTTSVIDARLEEINRLSREARRLNAQNIWDPEWDQGVEKFIAAFNKLSDLYSEIESYWYKFEQIERDLAKTKELDVLQRKIEETTTHLTSQYRRAQWMAVVFGLLSLLLLTSLLSGWLKR